MDTPRQFRYHIGRPGEADHELAVVVDATSHECLEPVAETHPWTVLGFHQCAGCPLDPARVSLCPLAARIAPAIRVIGPMLSYDELALEVNWGHRRLVGRASAQRVGGSVLGLVSAVSGCPRTAFLKPMAWFHLPLATEEETVFRAVSAYLLGQYLRSRDGKTPDWSLEGLKENYRHLHEVNLGIAARMRHAAEKDAAINAVVLLDLFTRAVPFSVDDSLEEFRGLFAADADSA